VAYSVKEYFGLKVVSAAVRYLYIGLVSGTVHLVSSKQSLLNHADLDVR
jgi:hypothetical protein